MSFRQNEIKEIKHEGAVSIHSESEVSELSGFTEEDAEDAKEIFHHEDRLGTTLNARLIAMISLVGVFGTGMYVYLIIECKKKKRQQQQQVNE